MPDDIAVERLGLQPIAFPAGGWPVDTDDLLGMGIHHGDQRQGVGVEVGIWIARAFVLGKAEALEIAAVLIGGIQPPIRPWLDDDFETFGEDKVRQGLAEQGGSETAIDQDIELAPAVVNKASTSVLTGIRASYTVRLA